MATGLPVTLQGLAMRVRARAHRNSVPAGAGARVQLIDRFASSRRSHSLPSGSSSERGENMNQRTFHIAVLCVVNGACGCSSVPRDAGPIQHDAPREATEPTPNASAAEPDPVASAEPDPAVDDVLVTGTVSGDFPVTVEDGCKPLGVPITMFLTGAFGGDALVDEMATPRGDARCSHEQTLAANAGVWATMAYEVVCRGGGDAKLCGATATRRCSLDLLVQWAERRSSSVSTREPTFGFEIDVPPQEPAARIAL